MLMNRGTDHDDPRGQTVTIFRETMGGKGRPARSRARARC
jgi:hypothetical protein